MRRKKKAIVIGSISLALVVVIIMSLFANHYISRRDCLSIKLNWGIDLFTCKKDLYYQDSGPSFLGDGDRLTVLQFKDFNTVSKIVNWEDGGNSQLEAEVANVISRLIITDKYKPDMNIPYKYYTNTQDDNNTLYLIYNMKNNYLYVVENIM